MFEIKGNEILELQIKAAEKEALELLNDEEETPLFRANALRQVVQMKERAARFVLEEMESIIERFKANGVSSVSLVTIAEACQQSIDASASQMQIFAKELAGLTHNKDMEECYSYIAERLSTRTADLLQPLKEIKENALKSVEDMGFVEIYEAWNNMENKPI